VTSWTGRSSNFGSVWSAPSTITNSEFALRGTHAATAAIAQAGEFLRATLHS
jgi:hypothetical protein